MRRAVHSDFQSQQHVDPILIAWGCFRYQIHFLGKKELESVPILRWLFNKLDMIPVDRHNMDMHAVRACLKTLKEGHVLGIFPEGTQAQKRRDGGSGKRHRHDCPGGAKRRWCPRT